MARNEMSSEEKLSIHDMKSNGASVKEIAKRFKRSSRLISRALKEVAAANGVTPAVSAAAPLEATRTPVQTAQSQQPAPMNQHAQVPQPQRTEPSFELLSPLLQGTDVEPGFLPPVQMSAQQLPPPPTQRKTAQTNPSALPAPPQKSSYAPLPLHQSSGPYDERYGSLVDGLLTDSRAMSALPASLPAPVPAPTAMTSKRATQNRWQPASMRPHQQSSSPRILPQLLQEISALPSTLRQEVAEKNASSSEPPQLKQSQAVSSPPRKQVHQQTLPHKPASASSGLSDYKGAAPITDCQSAVAAPAGGTTATSDVVPCITGATSGAILARRRPITRPPRVFPFTHPASTSSAGSVSKDGSDECVVAGQSTVGSKAASNQRADRRTETKVSPGSDLMALLMGLGSDEDTSPQTSQEEDPVRSQVEGLSQASGTSSKGQQGKTTSGASIPGTSHFGATQTTEQTQSEAKRQVKLNQLRAPSKVQLVVDSRGASASHSQISLPKQTDGGKAVPSGTGGPSKNHLDDNRSLLSSLQDQVENLQQGRLGDDRTNVRQFLSAIRDDVGLGTAGQHGERKRKRAEDAENTIVGKLLHEKIVAEVTLVNLQVQREKAQLHRERMRTEVEAALFRKKLEDANIPKLTIDKIFAQMIGE